jgi:D-glycero-D-manno-heptose 1,7-bisphosphate phosphatase
MIPDTMSRTHASCYRPTKKAVFLDRDGVLVKQFDGRPANTAEEIELLPGVVTGLLKLQELGFQLIVVTNQGGIAHGFTTPGEVFAMHRKIDALIAAERDPTPLPHISGYYICPHKASDRCECRKPRPGMLINAAADFDIDLAKSYIIGDMRSDMEAGTFAGLKKRILVVTDLSSGAETFADFVVGDFEHAVCAVAAYEGVTSPDGKCVKCGAVVKQKEGRYLGSDGEFRLWSAALPGDRTYCEDCWIVAQRS